MSESELRGYKKACSCIFCDQPLEECWCFRRPFVTPDAKAPNNTSISSSGWAAAVTLLSEVVSPARVSPPQRLRSRNKMTRQEAFDTFESQPQDSAEWAAHDAAVAPSDDEHGEPIKETPAKKVRHNRKEDAKSKLPADDDSDTPWSQTPLSKLLE